MCVILHDRQALSLEWLECHWLHSLGHSVAGQIETGLPFPSPNAVNTHSQYNYIHLVTKNNNPITTTYT